MTSLTWNRGACCLPSSTNSVDLVANDYASQWYGMVANAMVWYGCQYNSVVWCGMVWLPIQWYDMVPNDYGAKQFWAVSLVLEDSMFWLLARSLLCLTSICV